MSREPVPPPAADTSAIRDAAAAWVVRRDRRLTTAERTEFDAWLAADPRHPAAFARCSDSWGRFRALGTVARRLPPRSAADRARRQWPALATLAAAALLAFALLPAPFRAPAPAGSAAGHAAEPAATAAAAVRRLPDGSEATLRPGAEIAVTFSAAERRVVLLRGEVLFAVAKDPARPFFVAVGGTTVRAVGTAFVVRFDEQTVDVLVTEGVVRVSPPVADSSPTIPAAAPSAAESASALVTAGHRATVPRVPVAAAPAVAVSAVTPTQIARQLAWSQRLHELAGTPLGDLAAEIAARTGRRISIPDPTLAAVRLGGRFPVDDVDGLVRVLTEIYAVTAETAPDGTLVLHRRH